MQPANSSIVPFKNEKATLDFVQRSSIKGRKYEKIIGEIKNGEQLKVFDTGKKYRFEAGNVTLEINKNPPKRFHLIHCIRKALSNDYKEKYENRLKTIAHSLFEGMEKPTTTSPISASKPSEQKVVSSVSLELLNDVKARKDFLKDVVSKGTYSDEVGTSIKSFLNFSSLLDKDKPLDEEELKLLYQIGTHLSQDDKTVDLALKCVSLALHKLPTNSLLSPSHEEVIQFLQPIADSGNQKAKFELGYVLSKNKTTEQEGLKLIKDLAAEGYTEAETHLMLEQLRLYERTPCSFTEAIFQPLSKPEDFDSPLITKEQLNALLDKYPEIVNIKGKNGIIRHLLIEKFDFGIYALQGKPLNNQFKEEFKQLLTIINNCSNQKEQKILMNQLKNGFMDCEPGMQRCVSEMLTEQRSFEAGFADQVKIKIHEFKNQMLEELLLEKFPDAYTTKMSHLQMAHLKSGYITSLGKEFGLQGVEESSVDKNKYQFMKPGELNQAKMDLKQKIYQNFETFIKNYAIDLNNPLITADRGVGEKIASWKAKQKEDVDANFFYHAEEKQEFYEGDPNEDQEDLSLPFVSHAELKKCLDVLGLAKIKSATSEKMEALSHSWDLNATNKDFNGNAVVLVQLFTDNEIPDPEVLEFLKNKNIRPIGGFFQVKEKPTDLKTMLIQNRSSVAEAFFK